MGRRDQRIPEARRIGRNERQRPEKQQYMKDTCIKKEWKAKEEKFASRDVAGHVDPELICKSGITYEKKMVNVRLADMRTDELGCGVTIKKTRVLLSFDDKKYYSEFYSDSLSLQPRRCGRPFTIKHFRHLPPCQK